MKRNLYIGLGFAVVIAGLVACSAAVENAVENSGGGETVATSGNMAPMFEVDPLWPKPLPNNWVIGSTIGVSVDSQDHVWIIHRQGSLDPKELYASQDPPEALCCSAAPPVLEFDAEGNLLNHWGGSGEGYEWPTSNHGITVDYKDNVWIGGNGPADAQVLKFTQSGQLLMQIGHEGQSGGSNDTANLGRPAKLFIDPEENEVYVADGYGNRRVIVFDADTGEYKRHWGAYGHVPDDTPLGPYNPADPPAQQFRNPVHCADLSNDGMLYVCDRANDRIQVFQRDGTFVKETFILPDTLGDGSVFDLTFSRDPEQTYLYVADGSNDRIHVLLRDTLEELTSFGNGGRQPGQFYAVHSIATDSKGNVYTTETYEGKRVQKFTYKGLAPVTEEYQGTVWPK